MADNPRRVQTQSGIVGRQVPAQDLIETAGPLGV